MWFTRPGDVSCGGKILVPDERGVLVPEDQAAPTSDAERVLSLAANSGGSGKGMSYYSVAARCGRKANLDTARREQFREANAPAPATKNHFVVGSVYHKLQELAHGPVNDLPIIDLNERWANPNVAEGVRLFKGWLRTWGVGFWGRTVAVEEHLEDSHTFTCMNDMHTDTWCDMVPIPVTAALDMVVYMDAEACERAKRRGLTLEPGHYIVDWKTADGPSNGVAYSEGIQALWYCYAWNDQHPKMPVNGIIFDVVNKRSRRKDRSVLLDDFQAHFVPCGLERADDALRGLILQGHQNAVENRPNRAECISWQGDVCPYRMSGECDAIA